mmetsp:Transcript_93779/g.264867  ORF Transcript_93779/g.264867 Transcript_93779/m.264867 type:complete len:232 (-) Transcript_93779:473-1168(-)
MAALPHAPALKKLIPETDDGLTTDAVAERHVRRQASAPAPAPGGIFDNDETVWLRQFSWPGALGPSNKLCPPRAPRLKPKTDLPEDIVLPFELPPCHRDFHSSPKKRSAFHSSAVLGSSAQLNSDSDERDGDKDSLFDMVPVAAGCGGVSDGDKPNYESLAQEGHVQGDACNSASLPMHTRPVLKTFQDKTDAGGEEGPHYSMSPSLSFVFEKMMAEAPARGALPVKSTMA